MADFSNHILIQKRDDVSFEIDFAAESDKANLRTEYTDAYAGWKTRCPKFGSPHPEENSFYLVSIKASREPGSMIRVKLAYEAHTKTQFPSPEDDEIIRRYSVDTAEEEVSVLASKFAEALSDAELTALQQIINGTETKEDGTAWEDDVASADGIKVLAKIREGKTAVKQANFYWVESFISENLDDFALNEINKRDTPPEAPTMPAGYDWLRVASPVKQTSDGLAWEGDRRWQLSGPKGWDADFYAATA